MSAERGSFCVQLRDSTGFTGGNMSREGWKVMPEAAISENKSCCSSLMGVGHCPPIWEFTLFIRSVSGLSKLDPD